MLVTKNKKRPFPLRTSVELRKLLQETAELCGTNRSHIAEIVNRWIMSGRCFVDDDGSVVVAHPGKSVTRLRIPISYYFDKGNLTEDSFSMSHEPVLNDDNFRKCLAGACLDQKQRVRDFEKHRIKIYPETAEYLRMQEGVDYNVPESIVIARFLAEAEIKEVANK